MPCADQEKHLAKHLQRATLTDLLQFRTGRSEAISLQEVNLFAQFRQEHDSGCPYRGPQDSGCPYRGPQTVVAFIVDATCVQVILVPISRNACDGWRDRVLA